MKAWQKFLSLITYAFCILAGEMLWWGFRNFYDINIPKKINPDPRDLGSFEIFHSGIFRHFLENFSGLSNPNPDLRDFGIFGILHSGFFSEFFRGFKIPIREILGFSGFFFRYFFGIFKFRSRSPGFRDFRDFSI